MSRSSASEDSLLKERINEIDSKIKTCEKCRLCKSRTKAVPGDGRTSDLKLMIIGEAPGRNEDRLGKPFVGAGGKLLDSILNPAGIERRDVYITNIVKCRPPKNRKPKRDEIEICTLNYLEEQLKVLKPKLILTLGATALEYFTGLKVMGAANGKLTKTKKGIMLLPTYHPAAILRNRAYKSTVERDVKTVADLIRDL